MSQVLSGSALNRRSRRRTTAVSGPGPLSFQRFTVPMVANSRGRRRAADLDPPADGYQQRPPEARKRSRDPRLTLV